MSRKKHKAIEYLDDNEDIENSETIDNINEEDIEENEVIEYFDDEDIECDEAAGCLDEDEDIEGDEAVEYLDDGEDIEGDEAVEYLDDDEDTESDEAAEYLDDEEDIAGIEETEYPDEDDNTETIENCKAGTIEKREDGEIDIDDDAVENSGHKKRKKFVIAGLIFLILTAAAAAGGWYYIDSLAYKVCRVEAGIPVVASDFLKEPDEEAFFTQESQAFDIAEPGEYAIRVKSGMFTHRCTLIIEDTIAPSAEPVKVVLEIGESCDAESFVSEIKDATQVIVDYTETPDFTEAGSQPVQITLTDRGGNRTVLDSDLFISQILMDVTAEAGRNVPGLDSFVIAAENASFITDMEAIDYTKVGEYEISLEADGQTYESTLHIVDTVPPEITVQNIECYALLPLSAEAFTVSIEDATEVTAAYVEEPDFSYIGSQELEIVYTDGGSNEVIKQVTLTLMEDTDPPVIEGAADLHVFIGDSVSYRKNVSVTDNCPDGLLMTVDTTAVNLNEEGIYPVTYTAKDVAGNTTSVTVNLAVTPRKYDIEEVYAAADSVLAGIITPEMSRLEQARAIFDYIKSHVSYISDSVKDDWVRGAYEGLMYRKGDCFVYACTAKALLTRAGIANMDIAKIPAKTSHYWNLVDVGDGWYHFDTTPRKDHPVIFMWTDAQLMEYSDKHWKSHNYDHSLYPAVN